MAISIHDTDTGNMLAALSFCVWQYETQRKQAFVGGLQSFKSPKQKERIISITRDLHGLRPKALLFFVLQQLVVAWGLDSIRAVSDSRHVYRHYRKRKQVAMSYDEFWLECGGQLGPDGFFTLPAASTARDMTDMKPSKRQMYRRRYLLLQQFASQISNTLARHTLPENPAARSGSPKPIPGEEPGLDKLIGICDRQAAPGKFCTD